jgi:hypothetical protein
MRNSTSIPPDSTLAGFALPARPFHQKRPIFISPFYISPVSSSGYSAIYLSRTVIKPAMYRETRNFSPAHFPVSSSNFRRLSPTKFSGGLSRDFRTG